MSEALTDRQRRIIQRVASGEDWRTAARAEGCSDSYSRVIRTRMKKNPSVAKAIDAIQAEGRKLAVYDLAKAMKEAEEVIEFAKQHKHPTAYFFAVRHRAHLSGLLVDRFEIATVDLTGALSRAEQRVMSQTPQPEPSNSALPASVRWSPRIAGDEAGPADGQVKSVGGE